MKTNLLKLKRVFSATLFVLLLNVVGMTNAFAQGNVPTGAINGRFTVNDNGDQVYFSKGNLQYNATAHSWRFAENQYGYLGTANNNISSEYNGWIDLFGWGTSGYNHGAVCYQPWSTATHQTYYWAYGEETANLNDYTGKADWGYNQIINGGNVLNQWRTLTTEEWQYIFWNRTTTSGIIYAKANVNGVNGIILLPDNWNLDTYNLNNTNNAGCQFNSNVITDTQWLILENAGAIFLPAAGRRYEKDFSTNGGEGNYWSASYREDSPNNAYAVNFNSVDVHPNYSLTRDFGFSVRLVCSAPSIFYGINATPNPSDGGTIMGVGSYEAGETCTLTATANEGYTFINWTENSEVVSTEAEYSFTVDGDRTLVANFEIANIAFADENVKALCVANWDTNGDGELSYAEAAAVTDLGEVFKNNTTITSFDELQYFTGLTTIGWEAFAWCHNLTSIVLPSSITSIDGGAFNDCRNLLSITIPAAVTEIGFAALTCDNLETIIVEQGNTVYDSRDNCNAVIITSSNELIRGCKNTVIPNTVVSLYDHAFASCSMESINIPASVTNISTSAFYLCGNLATITVDANNVVYDSRNNSNAIIQTNTNKLVAGSKTTVIPNTVTAIGEYAFSNRFSIGSFSVTIPESVTLIEQNAYLGGYGIESISVLADIPPTLQSYAFAYVDKTIPVNVPCGTRSAYQAAEGWSEFTNITVDPECGRQITATVNPANTGSVTGAGSYDVGDICTLTATPESGYRFVNWTENNEVVSTNATYQFTVNANRDLVANFEEYVVTNHYVCDITQFADYMSVVAVVVIDGVEQESETLEIGAFSGDECRGGKFATFFPPTERYIYQIPVYGEGGDDITFKLYNHDLQEELDLTCTVELQWNKDGYGRLATPYEITFISSVNINASVNPANAGTITGAGTYMPGETATLTATANAGYVFANWTEGGNVVSQNATYSFTVTTARDLVANFNAAQSYTLNSGWNWFSTYIEQNGIDGLSMLEECLGEHGEFIQSRTGAMVENFDGSFWWGDLNAVTNEDMYEVKTNAQVSVTMTGSVANPASHPITVAPGWNWIGYVSDATKSVDNALSSLTPNEDDVIQGRNAFSSYFPGWGWYGDLENMTPGQGYMYKSNGTASQTLVYPTATRSTNTDIVDYHYNANYNKYRDVMDVMAKVIVNGDLPTSDRYELAAFVNGECRGRAKLQYVEPMQTYLAFITINGNDDETVTFSLYDEDLNVTYYASEANIVVFNANEVVGKFRNPYILSFNNAENVENTVFTVYPNPVAQGDEMTVNLMEEIAEAEMFVENELGLTVDAVKLSGKSAKVRFDWPSGVYVLRVVVDGNVYYNKVIVK